MDLSAIIKNARKVATDNSPTILTAIGVTGTITTAILAFRSGTKAERLLSEESPHLSLKEKAEKTWKVFIPPIGSGIATVSCIVLANRINMRRSAALASAYAVSQELFREYKDKVVDKLGPDEEKNLRDEIAEQRINKYPPRSLVVVGGKDCIVHDRYTDRWFTSSHDALKQAEIDINFQIIQEGYATLSDFWRALGVSHSAIGDEIGWNSDRKLELEIGGAVSDDGIPVLTLDFRTIPVRGYGSY